MMERKGKILVADDDRFMREMMRVILARAGYNVIFAEDGQSAIEMARTEKPDLVLTDGLLPKVHGFLVCKTIKEFEAPPKVVLVTAVYTKPTYKWEVKKEYGADDIVRKPFKAEELLACVGKHLADQASEKATNEAPPEAFEEEIALATAILQEETARDATPEAAIQNSALRESSAVMAKGFSLVPAV